MPVIYYFSCILVFIFNFFSPLKKNQKKTKKLMQHVGRRDTVDGQTVLPQRSGNFFGVYCMFVCSVCYTQLFQTLGSFIDEN